jgi:hypothetical protein
MSTTLTPPSVRFSAGDNAALERAAFALRPFAMTITVATDYPGRIEVAELSAPAGDEVRWFIYRDGGAIVLDEFDGPSRSFKTIEEAVNDITVTLENALPEGRLQRRC